jgi:hypothetical protein
MSKPLLAAATLAAASLMAVLPASAQPVMTGAEVTSGIKAVHLPSLRGAFGRPEELSEGKHVRELKKIPLIDGPGWADDHAAQTGYGVSPAAATMPGLGFDGVGKGFSGPAGNFTVQYAPPDTTGAVGATQYVQWVNVSLAVFDKATGTAVLGPVAGNTLWQSLGGPCATENDGDPIVQYDKLANRWVLSQFAVPGGSAGYWQCVAVSQTSDATGGYYLYAFPYTQFNDYPKLGVWPDGYYVTFNMFTNVFQGAKVCAYDRAKMLAGQAATQQCFQLSSSYGSLLPADLDGSTLPPAGAPNYLVNRLSGALGYWKFKVDWANAANSTLTGPTQIPVTAYNAACSGGTCIPQAGTTQKLDSLADRLMYRLAYRNLGGTETMVVNHAVQISGSSRGNPNKNAYAGVRWYEIRGMAGGSGTPTLRQQATYAPDTTFRWMGSIAMDKQGNMALGFSASSSAIKPAIRYATRAAGDALNMLSNETVVMQGAGAQTQSLSRWGDYTQMTVDPVDDCTFWYTGQYLKADGTFNWSTRIASFKIQGCQ